MQNDRRVWTLNGVLTVLALGMYAATMRALGPAGHEAVLGHGFPGAWFVLLVLFTAAEFLVIQLVVRRQGYAISLSELPLVIGLFFTPVPTLLVLKALGSAIGLLIYRQQRPLKLCFNVAQMALATIVTVAVFRMLSPGASPVTLRAATASVIAAVAGILVASLSIAAAVVLYDGRVTVGRWAAILGANILAVVTNTSLALMVVVLLWTNPSTGWLTILPAAALLFAYRSIRLSREKQQGLEFLYAATTALQRGASREGPLVDLLALAREMFHAETAELVLVREGNDGHGLRTAVGPDEEVHRMVPVTVHPADLEGTSSRTEMVAPLDGERRRLGRLRISGPSEAQAKFSPRQLQLFDTLVNHVAVALENGILEASLAEVTALKEELRHQAFHDELTGLANRALFLNELERVTAASSSAGSVAVLYIDLDAFKAVNDAFGHAAGDEVLRRTAEHLRQCVRPGDLAARLGGDEFAVLLAGRHSRRDALAVAERLHPALCAPMAIFGETVRIGASIGVAGNETGVCTAAELLQNADEAMYVVKIDRKKAQLARRARATRSVPKAVRMAR